MYTSAAMPIPDNMTRLRWSPWPGQVSVKIFKLPDNAATKSMMEKDTTPPPPLALYCTYKFYFVVRYASLLPDEILVNTSPVVYLNTGTMSREYREKKTKCDRIAPSHPLGWPCVSDLLYLKARAATCHRNPR